MSACLGILFQYGVVLRLKVDLAKEDLTLKICSPSHNHHPETASLNYLPTALILIWPKLIDSMVNRCIWRHRFLLIK